MVRRRFRPSQYPQKTLDCPSRWPWHALSMLMLGVRTMLLECSWCSVQPATLGQMQNYNCMVRRTSRRDYITVWITVQLLTVCPRPSVLDKLLAIELLFTLWCKQAPRSATDHAVIILHLASCCGSGLRTPSTLIAFVRTPNSNLYLAAIS